MTNLKKFNLRNRKGFTLTELIVVIAIIAILAAVLIPSSVIFISRAKENADLQDATSAYRSWNAYAASLASSSNATEAEYSELTQIVFVGKRTDDLYCYQSGSMAKQPTLEYASGKIVVLIMDESFESSYGFIVVEYAPAFDATDYNANTAGVTEIK